MPRKDKGDFQFSIFHHGSRRFDGLKALGGVGGLSAYTEGIFLAPLSLQSFSIFLPPSFLTKEKDKERERG